MSEEPSKHLTVFPSETANIKKLANLTANTKNYEQIALNTKPHSNPPKDASNSVKKRHSKYHKTLLKSCPQINKIA